MWPAGADDPPKSPQHEGELDITSHSMLHRQKELSRSESCPRYTAETSMKRLYRTLPQKFF